MQVIKLTLSKTDKSRRNSSIVVTYREARIISNHLAQLNAVLARPTKLTATNRKHEGQLSKVQTCSLPSTKKTKLSNRREINSSLN